MLRRAPVEHAGAHDDDGVLRGAQRVGKGAALLEGRDRGAVGAQVLVGVGQVDALADETKLGAVQERLGGGVREEGAAACGESAPGG